MDAFVSGSLALSAGSKGQLVPYNQWLSKMKNITQPENAGFGSAKITFDGSFDAIARATEPFEVDAGEFKGYFREPYILDLLNSTAINTTRPDVAFDIDLPDIGDLGNITFAEVIELLQLALEFLVGSEEGDSVESCSGGLLGKEFFGKKVFLFKIPVMGVSACDTARFLQVVVDAVDTLVNDCPSAEVLDENSISVESRNCSGTFQGIEAKLEGLLVDGVGGTPNVVINSTSDTIRSVLELEMTLSWSFDEILQLQIDLAEILEGLELSEDIATFVSCYRSLHFDGFVFCCRDLTLFPGQRNCCT